MNISKETRSSYNVVDATDFLIYNDPRRFGFIETIEGDHH